MISCLWLCFQTSRAWHCKRPCQSPVVRQASFVETNWSYHCLSVPVSLFVSQRLRHPHFRLGHFSDHWFSTLVLCKNPYKYMFWLCGISRYCALLAHFEHVWLCCVLLKFEIWCVLTTKILAVTAEYPDDDSIPHPEQLNRQLFSLGNSRCGFLPHNFCQMMIPQDDKTSSWWFETWKILEKTSLD